ncbi:MAG: hypothetical protein IPK19_21915 [Chloroflexi bacterium]|nr:hypothetical protein [Chloroflexota bacterium]
MALYFIGAFLIRLVSRSPSHQLVANPAGDRAFLRHRPSPGALALLFGWSRPRRGVVVAIGGAFIVAPV